MIAEWSGFLSAAVAKIECIRMLECLQEHPVTKVLNCNKKVTGHYAGAIDWVGKVWFSELQKAGLKYFAWVYSPEFYTQVGTDEVISFNDSVSVETFYSFENAYQWLLTK